MTNNWKDGDKLPIVGKRYCLTKRYLDNNNNKTARENKKVIVTEIEEREKDYLIHYKEDDGITNRLCSISFLGLYYEELTENKVNEKTNPINFEEKEVSKVEMALEELKYSLARKDNHEFKGHVFFDGYKEHWEPLLNILNKIAYEAENFVEVLEAEKNLKTKQRIAELEEIIKSYKIASFIVPDKWIKELEELKNMSKPEPKIDMKEECIEPVKIILNFFEEQSKLKLETLKKLKEKYPELLESFNLK